MQRSSVLLPEPLLPMMAITSPRLTSRSTPFSTSFVPKRLRRPRISTMATSAGGVSGHGCIFLSRRLLQAEIGQHSAKYIRATQA